VSEVAADADGADSAHAAAVVPAALAQASAMPAAATWPATQNYAEAMARFETAFLTQALEACGGRVAEAAARVGISRAAFYRKLAAAR
jgi:DNA-binding NtrC family response regulator